VVLGQVPTPRKPLSPEFSRSCIDSTSNSDRPDCWPQDVLPEVKAVGHRDHCCGLCLSSVPARLRTWLFADVKLVKVRSH
jgi:hypothetical protein